MFMAETADSTAAPKTGDDPDGSIAPHPDARLLAGWAAFIGAHRALDAACARLPNGGTDADHEPYYERLAGAREIIEDHNPATLAGIETLLRYVAHELVETPSCFDAVAAPPGTAVPVEAAGASDYRDRLLLRAVAALAGLTRAQRTPST